MSMLSCLTFCEMVGGQLRSGAKGFIEKERRGERGGGARNRDSEGMTKREKSEREVEKQRNRAR